MGDPRILGDGTRLERIEAYVRPEIKTLMFRAAMNENLSLRRWLEKAITELVQKEKKADAN